MALTTFSYKSLIRNRIVPLELMANHSVVEAANCLRSQSNMLMKQVLPYWYPGLYAASQLENTSINKKSQDSFVLCDLSLKVLATLEIGRS